MILDSSYLFDLMRNDPAAFEKGVELVEQGEIQWLPTPVVAEAYYGVFTSGSNRTEAELRNRLLGYPRVDVTEEVARTAGKLLVRAPVRRTQRWREVPVRTTPTSVRWPRRSTTQC